MASMVSGSLVKVASADDVVEYKAHEHSRYIVERRRGRHVVRACKDEREIEILEEIQLETSCAMPIGSTARWLRRGRKTIP
jgi:hypothetical protein